MKKIRKKKRNLNLINTKKKLKFNSKNAKNIPRKKFQKLN